MQLVGFDERQAALSGNRVVYLPTETQLVDGRSGAVLGRVPLPTVRPWNGGIVFGSCGSSYIYMVDLPGPRFTFTTGFDIDELAVLYSWQVDIRGEYENGVDSIDWENEGPLAARATWTSGDVRQQQDAPSGTTY